MSISIAILCLNWKYSHVYRVFRGKQNMNHKTYNGSVVRYVGMYFVVQLPQKLTKYDTIYEQRKGLL
jgi:hypothetical protein